MKIRNEKTKIETAIIKNEGKATARTCNYTHFTDLVKFAEDKLNGLGLAKKHWKGVRATFKHGAVCNSYGYPAIGTELTIERFTSGWFLVGVSRGYVGSCPHGGHDRYKIKLPKATQIVFVDNSPYLSDIKATIHIGLDVEAYQEWYEETFLREFEAIVFFHTPLVAKVLHEYDSSDGHGGDLAPSIAAEQCVDRYIRLLAEELCNWHSLDQDEVEKEVRERITEKGQTEEEIRLALNPSVKKAVASLDTPGTETTEIDLF